MRRAAIGVLLGVGVGSLGVAPARAQVPDVIGVPAPGDPGGRELGWRVSNGFGYGAIGPRGYGYYPGLYTPTFNEDGQSPAYNPIFNSLETGPGSYVEPSKRGTTLLGRTVRRLRRHH